jgi:single-strand DNA-binding protein
MDNVVIGRLCKDPILHQPRRTGQPVARLTVAVNVWRRVGDSYVERPAVFHRVVCFGQLAENVSNSLRKGMEVLAVGEWVDDSYSDEVGHRRIQVTLEAKVIGPTLRRATALVHKVERRPDNQLALASVGANGDPPGSAVEPGDDAAAEPVVGSFGGPVAVSVGGG